MADYNYGGSDEENVEIRRLNSDVDADTDSFDAWEKLIRACEALDGGLNRNSSPQALATMRDAYDRFLLKFPLLFGYWKKYADFEFNISGPEAAEMVYERGCASITNSVDLWTEFCAFKMETTHVPQAVRELFERAAHHVGLDFLAHPFWDKYIEYEDRLESSDNIFAILKRIIQIPMHQYARYFERFRQLAQTRPVAELAEAETISRFQDEIEAEYGVHKAQADLDSAVRTKMDAYYYEVFTKTQVETNKRWTFEAEIKRPYFHVTELEYPQLANWRKYLDFEEAEGDYERTVFLYERCLVTCAFYDEFWFRYTRWMQTQPGKDEDVRIIYLRASALYVPISRPGIRLQFAYFEESCGRIDVARDVHAAILLRLPNSVETILSWAHLERRQSGLDAAIDVLKQQIDLPTVDLYTKAALVTQWAQLLWKIQGRAEEARAVYAQNVQWYADSRAFWAAWLDFELAQPANGGDEAKQAADRITAVFHEMRTRSRLSQAAKRELCQPYLAYLQERGGKDAMKQYLAVDREMYGPTSVSFFAKNSAKAKEDGTPIIELDEATLQRAEAHYHNYYELFSEPSATAQGPAPFN